jgi:hypothetical protein
MEISQKMRGFPVADCLVGASLARQEGMAGKPDLEKVSILVFAIA